MKTTELIGIALDRAVAKANGDQGFDRLLAYSSNWSVGGPIIERELLSPEPLLDTNCALIKWHCRNWKGDGSDFYGPTPLIAAMRCFVASKLGDEVDVPEELCGRGK